MSQTTNEDYEGGRVKKIEPTVDPDVFASVVVNSLEQSGTDYPMSMIEELRETGEMEWLVKAAERRMLEVCAERLEKFNTSERAVEWFRDYHGLNDEEAELNTREKAREWVRENYNVDDEESEGSE